jgi:hypothetical protein
MLFPNLKSQLIMGMTQQVEFLAILVAKRQMLQHGSLAQIQRLI